MPWDPGYGAGEGYDRAEFVGGTIVLIVIAVIYLTW